MQAGTSLFKCINDLGGLPRGLTTSASDLEEASWRHPLGYRFLRMALPWRRERHFSNALMIWVMKRPSFSLLPGPEMGGRLMRKCVFEILNIENRKTSHAIIGFGGTH